MDVAEPPAERAGFPTASTTHPVILEGRYRLDVLIGQGGMADVYRGEDQRLGRPVAVKVFRPGSDMPGADLRQRSEVRVLASLSHPGLVAVYDAGTDAPDTAAQRSYLVMELITGTTLARRIADGPLDPGEVGEIGAQLASALAYVHGQGVVHRDVKPANILLAAAVAGHGATTAAKLTDFGIARLLDEARITTYGSTVGTANYLSPEQATGGEIGPPSDIYSLGLVLLEALTAAVAYPGHGVGAAAARLHRPPAIPDSLPAGWAALLTAMTSSDPAGRPDAAHVAAHLRTLAGRIPLASAPTAVLSTAAQGGDVEPSGLYPTRILPPPSGTATPSNRRRITMITIAAAAVIGLVVLLIALNSGGAGRPHTGLPAGSSTPPASPTTSAVSAPSITASTRPPPAPTTPLQAIAALRAAILNAVNSGTLDPAAAQDLNNRLDDLAQTVAQPSKGNHGHKPQPNPAAQKVADLAHHVSDLTQNGQLSPVGLQQIAGPLATLEHLIPATQ